MLKPFALAAILGASAVAFGGTAFAAYDDTGRGATRYTDALNILEAKGYNRFTGFKKTGDDFQASVTRNGKQETVVVDPDSHSVTFAH